MAIQDTNLQSNRQHAVPQNIMDVEFKIIGDLTMRQFSYLLILGLAAYFNMNFMVGIFKWPLTLFFGLLGLGLAFVPVQDRGLDVWLVNFIKSVYSPTQRVWKKTLAVPSAFLYDNLAVVKQELITLAPTSSRRKLEEYLDYSNKTLPRDPLDIPVDEYILKVRQAYSSVKVAEPVSVASDVIEQYTPKSVAEFISKEEPIIVDSEAKKDTTSSLSTLVSKLESNVGSALKDISTIAKDVSSSVSTVASSIVHTPKEVSHKEDISKPIEKLKVVEENPKQVPVLENKTKSIAHNPITQVRKIQPQSYSPVYAPITPDRHSGRRFTSFLPEQGEIVLPIRGERVLKTSDQIKLEENLEEKTAQLQQLLTQIRQSNVPVTTPKPQAVIKDESTFTSDSGNIKMVSNANKVNTLNPLVNEDINVQKKDTVVVSKDMLVDLVKQRESLMNELSSLRLSNANSEKIVDLQKLLQQINNQYQQVKKELQDIENTTQAKSVSKSSTSSIAMNTSSAFSNPNIVWGFVKDSDGKPVIDTVVIIKNGRGEPVRALKTNPLGQFNLTTPISNGKYLVEVSNSNKLGLVFDPTSIEASGNVIPSLEFIGHKS